MRCLLAVSVDLERCLRTRLYVRPGEVVRKTVYFSLYKV